jgi:hypothetical protein
MLTSRSPPANLSNHLGRLFARATASAWRRTGLAIFRITVGCLLLLRWGPALPGAGHLASLGRIAFAHGGDGWFQGTAVRLCASNVGIAGLIGLIALGGLCLATNMRPRLATIVVWLALLAVFRGFPDLASPGDHFIIGVLPYLILVGPSGRPVEGRFWVWLHNVAVVGIVAQGAILVFLTAFARAHALSWHNGTALYLIAQHHQSPASLPVQDLTRNPVIATALTYSVLLGGLWYPIFSALGWRVRGVAVGAFCAVQLVLCFLPPLTHLSLLIIGSSSTLLSDSHYDLMGRVAANLRRHLRGAASPRRASD